MTIKSANIASGTIRATADVAADRLCPRCRSTFRSEGFGERIWSRCKGSVAWRTPCRWKRPAQASPRRRTGLSRIAVINPDHARDALSPRRGGRLRAAQADAAPAGDAGPRPDLLRLRDPARRAHPPVA